MKHIAYGLGEKVCLITGGAQGIGEACARLFLEQGAKVVIVDVDKEKGQALASQLQQQGHEILLIVSNAASYITGEVITVDGGRMALNYTVKI